MHGRGHLKRLSAASRKVGFFNLSTTFRTRIACGQPKCLDGDFKTFSLSSYRILMKIVRETHLTFEFGPFHLDLAERLLVRNGKAVPLAPKVFETLAILVENSGHTLEKDELMKRLWPDRFVEESSLSQNIFQLRRALDEGKSGRQYIETIP